MPCENALVTFSQSIFQENVRNFRGVDRILKRELHKQEIVAKVDHRNGDLASKTENYLNK